MRSLQLDFGVYIYVHSGGTEYFGMLVVVNFIDQAYSSNATLVFPMLDVYIKTSTLQHLPPKDVALTKFWILRTKVLKSRG